MNLESKRWAVGEAIREIRKRKGVTIKQLASAIGISHVKLGNIERGIDSIRQSYLQRIADYLKVSIESFSVDDEHTRKVMDEINDIILNRIEDYDLGVELCEKEISKSAPSSMKYLQFHRLLGKLHLHRGLYQKSYDAFRVFYDGVKNMHDRETVFAACYNMASVCYHLKRFEEGLKYLDEGTNGKKEKQNDKAIHLRALFLLELGKPAEAIGVFKELQTIYIENKNLKDFALTYHNIGWAYWLSDDVDTALEYYEQSLKISKEHRFYGPLAYTAYDLARLYILKDRVKDAEDLINYMLDISSIPTLYRARLLFVMSKCKEDPKDKIVWLNEVLKYSEVIKDDPQLCPNVYAELGWAYYDLGDYLNYGRAFEMAFDCVNLKKSVRV